MYKCTDCDKIYNEHPGYCECGNDQFVEIPDIQQAYVQPEYQQNEAAVQLQRTVRKVKKKTKQPPKKTVSKQDMVGYIVFAICIILSIFAWIFIGYGQKSTSKAGGKVVLVKNTNIPVNIDDIWDSSTPATKPVDPKTVLNTKLTSLDGKLSSYLNDLINDINLNWDKSGVSGDGTYSYEFAINKEGGVTNKKVFKTSGNKSLDDSVAKYVNGLTTVAPPPETYNQETIIVSFKCVNGIARAFIPSVKTK